MLSVGRHCFHFRPLSKVLIEARDIPESNTHQIANERLGSSLNLRDGEFKKRGRPNNGDEVDSKYH